MRELYRTALIDKLYVTFQNDRTCGHHIGLGYEGENFAYLVFFLFSCYVVMVATFTFN